MGQPVNHRVVSPAILAILSLSGANYAVEKSPRPVKIKGYVTNVTSPTRVGFVHEEQVGE